MKSGNLLRGLVVATGVVVFVLLFFADKTSLNNKKTAEITAPQARVVDASASIPPLAPDEKFDSWVLALKDAQGSQQQVLLDSVIQHLQQRNRPDHAAAYAARLAQTDSSFENLALAGSLHLQASQLDYVMKDTALSRNFATQAIAWLVRATALEPRNEDALLNLGMAYIASGRPENSMRGIMSIRQVTEINPANPEAQFRLGLFSVQTQQWPKAAERFENVLKLEPDNAVAMYQLAYVRVQMGQPQGTKAMLEKVLTLTEDAKLRQAARELLNVVP